MMMGLYQIGSSAVIALIAAYLLTGSRWRTLYILYRTLPRDIIGSLRFLKVNILLWYWEKRDFTVAKLFTRQVEAHPDKIVIIFEDQEWSYKKLDKFTNRFARFMRTQPYSRGDSIALLMGNRPEYIGIWLALSKAGFVTALINTNLRKDALIHSIRIAESKAIIFGGEFKEAIEEIRNTVSDLSLYQWSEDPNKPVLQDAVDLNSSVANTADDPIIVDMSLACPRDKLIYIYTSGTTGMPKAAVITNLRYMLMTCGVYCMLGLRQTDRIYNSLPLYHSAGGIIGAGQAICNGITIVIRKKFSASNFWSDCIRHDCTIAQYIGEICRFLLSVPPSPNDTKHKVRLMFGNGLRPQIWETFTKRFKVKQIGEFYGATEGNSNLVNIDGKVGAVGFLPLFAGPIYPVVLIKIDEETGEPVRGPDGLCIRCKPGEPGIFVGKINPKKAVHDFNGYADKRETEKKIIHDVLKKGDRVFNSGDILVMDEFGYFYFKDRRGDTFRWKGENVSTTEIEAVISNVVNLKDAVVYGVEVVGNEGKAGMAAIYDPEGSLNIKELEEGLKKNLPLYARPIFVRVLSELPLTGTFKLQKRDLQKEGYDITQIKDPVYFLNKSGNYERFTEQLYQDLLSEKLRV
ncbi:long-chain fatty acid transport protein 4-like [Chelonus insularis]|uniref:long-chain fatty acid transport protein 4-like n=1 Tax=Chelonus insularis TaxID=460826 RepID=UPI00158DC029|nr:long-chain fatty acid transport protein 4-like [Chelonus insularis]